MDQTGYKGSIKHQIIKKDIAKIQSNLKHLDEKETEFIQSISENIDTPLTQPQFNWLQRIASEF